MRYVACILRSSADQRHEEREQWVRNKEGMRVRLLGKSDEQVLRDRRLRRALDDERVSARFTD